jgi:hypothetical protein
MSDQTTNDEQTPYGEQTKQGAQWLPKSETFGHHVIPLDQPNRVEDGQWVHVYYPNTGLYSHSIERNLEVLLHMVPNIIEL